MDTKNIDLSAIQEMAEGSMSKVAILRGLLRAIDLANHSIIETESYLIHSFIVLKNLLYWLKELGFDLKDHKKVIRTISGPNGIRNLTCHPENSEYRIRKAPLEWDSEQYPNGGISGDFVHNGILVIPAGNESFKNNLVSFKVTNVQIPTNDFLIICGITEVLLKAELLPLMDSVVDILHTTRDLKVNLPLTVKK